MNTEEGKIWYSVSLDTSNLKADAERAKSIFIDMGRNAETEGARIDGMGKRAGAIFGSYISGQQALSFVKSIATVRGEFQQLEVSFNTMLGSKTKADALMSQIIDTAAKTPFDFQEVAQGAKQLLAYGSESEKVNETLIRLGNISAGLSIPLGDMVGLYGTTMAQGRLFTQDFRQFMSNGIPLADELAKQFGVTKERVGELVTEGKIGFPEVQKAIESMTSEGGKFQNVMQKQSTTMTGQISNLGDAWGHMLNDIGKSHDGLISGTIKGATSIVNNYEVVQDALVSLIATYGVYKASVMTMSAVNNVQQGALYDAEIAELQNLLPIKEASKNADLEQLVVKGKLTDAQSKQIIAMREKVKEELKELIIKEKALAGKVSEAAKDDAIALKQALNAERNERIARQELSDAILFGNAQKIKRAEIKLTIAEEELNIALKNKEVTANNLASASTKAKSATTAVDTMQQNLNTSSTKAAITAKGLFTVATGRLSVAMKSLKTAFASNPIGMAITLLTTAASAMYTFWDSTKKTSNLTTELNSQLTVENSKIDILFNRLNNATEGTNEYDNAKKSILDNYGQYLQGLDVEISSLNNVKAAYDAIKKSAKESLIERLRAEKLGEANSTAMTGFDNAYDDIFKSLKRAFKDDKTGLANTTMAIVREALEAENTSVLSDTESAYYRVSSALKNKFKGKGGIVILNRISGGINDWLKTSKQWKNEITEIDAKLAPISKKINEGGDSKKETVLERRIRETKELAEANKKLISMEANDSTSTKTEIDTQKNKIRGLEQSLGIDKRGSDKSHSESARQKEEAKKAEEELRNLLVDMRHDTTQFVIDAYEDGAWKELAQIQLNYDKKQVAIERWEKEQRNAVIEAQKKKYIGEHGSDKGFVVNNSAPEFATITASVEAQTALNKKVQSDALDANSKSEKDAMNDYLAAWGNMEEKRAAITAQYAEKRRNAKTKGENLSLDKEEEKSISDLEVENLLGSADAKTLFGDLDNLSSKTIQTIAASLRVKAKEKFKDGTLGEQEYLDMLKRIGDVEKQAQSNNPFAMLARSAKDAFSKIDKDDEDSTNKRKASWREFGVAMGGSLDLAAQAMQEVGNIADTLGVSEETKATISQVTGMLSGAGDLAKGVATGDVSSIIKGAGSMITSMINLFDFRTKRANKIIKEEAVNIEETKKKYKDLERTVKGALGTDYYQKQIDGAKLLQDQISSIDKQIAAEESKRKGKRNNDQIDAWKEEQKELTEQIKETKQKVVDELSTTDLKSYSMDLSSSIIDGLASGLDNANEVIDEKMDTLLKNMIAKQFDMLVAQEQMKPMFEAMADGFGEKSEGGFALTDSELKKIVEKGNQGKAGIISSLDDYEKILEEFGLVNEDITDKANSAAGAISAELTEQTGSELLGMQRLQSDTLLQLKEINNYGFSFIRESWSDISNLAAATLQIEANTYRAANNTDSLSDGLKVIGDRLEKIEKNTTKSYTK